MIRQVYQVTTRTTSAARAHDSPFKGQAKVKAK